MRFPKDFLELGTPCQRIAADGVKGEPLSDVFLHVADDPVVGVALNVPPAAAWF